MNTVSQKQTHTTGPWTKAIDSHSDDSHAIIAANGKQVATVHGTDIDGDDAEQAENLLNLRLIAAAPELLAALTEAGAMLLSLRADHEGAWHDTEIAQVESAINAARTAIAKAEGRA